MYTLRLIILIFLPSVIFGQTKKDKYYIDEFGISINKTLIVHDPNTSNDYGFGLYTSFDWSHKKYVNFIFAVVC
jgi:hypothetical protein